MQLWQLTTAVVAGSQPPRQWLLLPIPGKDVFALGMIAGAMAVALARGWLWWRGPKRSARTGTRGARQVPQPASAPVSLAVRPTATPVMGQVASLAVSDPVTAAPAPVTASPGSVIASAEPVTASRGSLTASAEPVRASRRSVIASADPVTTLAGPVAAPPEPAVADAEPAAGPAGPGGPAEPDVRLAVGELLSSLERLKVTLATGRSALVDRYLSAAVTELASGMSPCGRCDLVLVGFPAPASASGLTMRRDTVSAALDVLAARTVAARRRLAETQPRTPPQTQLRTQPRTPPQTQPRTWPLTVFVSRVVPKPAELAMLVDLVNEPGRVAALLPAQKADQLDQLPPAASVVELSGADGQLGGLTSTLLASPKPPSDVGRSSAQARPASLRIGVLGQLTINGQPGALLPAQTQLILALALNGEAGLLGKQLCELLGSDSDHPKPADSLRQLIARTRRQLGRTSDGGEWIEHLGHGRYALRKETRLDWHEFERLTDQGIRAGDASQLTAALAMIRGQPFTGCYYWWLDIELIDAVSAKIVTAAVTLAELALGRRDSGAAARAARIGLVADVTSEELWRQLMRAEHAAGNLAGVRDAWSRCVDAVAEIAVDGEPEPATAALYHQLLDR